MERSVSVLTWKSSVISVESCYLTLLISWQFSRKILIESWRKYFFKKSSLSDVYFTSKAVSLEEKKNHIILHLHTALCLKNKFNYMTFPQNTAQCQVRQIQYLWSFYTTLISSRLHFSFNKAHTFIWKSAPRPWAFQRGCKDTFCSCLAVYTSRHISLNYKV